MDPYSPLPPSASCRNGQHETAKGLEGLLTNCCKIITFTVPCDMVDQTRRWREIHGQKGTLRCRGRRRVVPLDQGRGYRGRRESCGGEKRPGSSNNREREVRWIEEAKFPLSGIVSVTGLDVTRHKSRTLTFRPRRNLYPLAGTTPRHQPSR